MTMLPAVSSAKAQVTVSPCSEVDAVIGRPVSQVAEVSSEPAWPVHRRLGQVDIQVAKAAGGRAAGRGQAEGVSKALVNSNGAVPTQGVLLDDDLASFSFVKAQVTVSPVRGRCCHRFTVSQVAEVSSQPSGRSATRRIWSTSSQPEVVCRGPSGEAEGYLQ